MCACLLSLLSVCVCIVLLVYASVSETHDMFEPYEFMTDSTVEEAYELLGSMFATFGPKIPLLSKFRVPKLHLVRHL